jgi:hypothetical protein
MADWSAYLTLEELDRLFVIDRQKRALTAERQAMHNRAKQRKHRGITASYKGSGND